MSLPRQVHVQDDLGKYTSRDTEAVQMMDWEKNVELWLGQGDFAELDDLWHPAWQTP